MKDHYETVRAFLAESLTMDQVAEHFGVTRLTVKNWLRDGKIKGHKFGRDWVIHREEIDRYHRTQYEALAAKVDELVTKAAKATPGQREILLNRVAEMRETMDAMSVEEGGR